MEVVDTAQSLAKLVIGLDALWMPIAAFLVFFMTDGIAQVKSCLCRSKNTVTILPKNSTFSPVTPLSFFIGGISPQRSSL